VSTDVASRRLDVAQRPAAVAQNSGHQTERSASRAVPELKHGLRLWQIFSIEFDKTRLKTAMQKYDSQKIIQKYFNYGFWPFGYWIIQTCSMTKRFELLN